MKRKYITRLIKYKQLLFDCCGTGIESDGKSIDSDVIRFICVGLIKDGELTTTSESVVLVVSSIFLAFSFDFSRFLLAVSLSERIYYFQNLRN
jgi:hypothetical protein